MWMWTPRHLARSQRILNRIVNLYTAHLQEIHSSRAVVHCKAAPAPLVTNPCTALVPITKLPPTKVVISYYCSAPLHCKCVPGDHGPGARGDGGDQAPRTRPLRPRSARSQVCRYNICTDIQVCISTIYTGGAPSWRTRTSPPTPRGSAWPPPAPSTVNKVYSTVQYSTLEHSEPSAQWV